MGNKFEGFFDQYSKSYDVAFFLAFLPQFIPAQTETPLINMLALGGIFMSMTLFIFMLYGLLANSVSVYVAHSPKAIKYVRLESAATFVMLAVKLAMTER
jgi:threonine/homoserine/homoserine lactone efflux protein